MSCESWQDLIALGSGGNLSETEATALEQHLHGCIYCRRYAEEIAASQRALRRFHELPLEETSLGRIRSGVLARVANEKASRSVRKATPWLALAASLILGLVLWPRNLRETNIESQQTETNLVVSSPPPSIGPPAATPVAFPEIATELAPTQPTERPRKARDHPGSRRDAEQQRLERYPMRRGSVEVQTTNQPLESSPGLVVFDLPKLQPSSLALVAPPGSGTNSPGPVVLDLPTQVLDEPTLQRVSEHPGYTIYWLKVDTLKEKENASTKIL